MAHLKLVASTPAPRTDARLLTACRQYLLGLAHIQDLRARLTTAQAVANRVLRDPPDDPAAAALWSRLWAETPACHLSHGVEREERRLAELLAEIAQTPARTEGGLRARLNVWRTVIAADDADALLDSIVTDCRPRRGRTRA